MSKQKVVLGYSLFQQGIKASQGSPRRYKISPPLKRECEDGFESHKKAQYISSILEKIRELKARNESLIEEWGANKKQINDFLSKPGKLNESQLRSFKNCIVIRKRLRRNIF